jgi:hypothetical protein
MNGYSRSSSLLSFPQQRGSTAHKQNNHAEYEQLKKPWQSALLVNSWIRLKLFTRHNYRTILTAIPGRFRNKPLITSK